MLGCKFRKLDPRRDIMWLPFVFRAVHPELGKQRAEFIEGKVRVVSTSRQLVEQFLRPAHGPRIVAARR